MIGTVDNPGKEAITMDQTQMVTRIIETEHQAQSMTAQARDQKLRLRDELRVQAEERRTELLEQAERRISRVRECENSAADQAVEEINRRHRAEMDAMENLFSQNRENWIDTLYHMVIERTGPS